MYDSLKINQLTNHGKDDDQARRKKEDQQLNELKKQIKTFDAQILEIRLALKDSIWDVTLMDKLPESPESSNLKPFNFSKNRLSFRNFKRIFIYLINCSSERYHFSQKSNTSL